jgi:hypothetical protein
MWQVNIDVLNIAQKLARVTAIRTPIQDEAEYQYSCTAILNTASQRSAVLDQIKLNYLTYLERQDQADVVVAGLEDTAANALNDWEENL